MFLQEVPSPTETANGLRVALRLSVPLFAQPASAETHALQLQWQAAGTGSTLQLHNSGNRHERISRLKITDAQQRVLLDGPRLLYILPGQTHSISLPDTAVSLPLSIDTTSDQGTEQHTLTQPTS